MFFPCYRLHDLFFLSIVLIDFSIQIKIICQDKGCISFLFILFYLDVYCDEKCHDVVQSFEKQQQPHFIRQVAVV